MAGELDPVVIPVVAKVDKSALDELGPSIQSARSAGGAGPTMGQSGTADQVSVRAVVREFTQLRETAKLLAGDLERLSQWAQTIVARGVPGGPGTPASGAGAPLINPAAPGTQVGGGPAGSGTPPPVLPNQGGGGSSGGGGGARQLAASVFFGQLGADTVRAAFQAAYGEVQRMAHESRSLEESTYFTAGAIGRPERAPSMLAQFRAGLGFPQTTTPEDGARSARHLALAGAQPTAREAMLLAEAGQRTMGSAEAGAGFGAQLFRDTRSSSRALELMMTSEQYAKTNALNSVEVTNQLTSLNSYFRSVQGPRRVSDGEMNDRVRLRGWFNSLPGGIGEGEGAAQLQQGIAGAAKHDPIARGAARSMFRERYGIDPLATAEGGHKFALYLDSPELTQDQMRAADRFGGGNKYRKALFLERHFGLTPQQADAMINGTPDQKRHVTGILDRQQSERALAARATTDASDPGADSAAAAADRARGGVNETYLSWLSKKTDHLMGRFPYGRAIGSAAGVLAPIAGWGLLKRGLRGLRGAPATAARAGVAAPTMAMAGRLATILGGAARLGGVAAIGNEIYDAQQSPGDDWQRVLRRNAAPLGMAIAGGAMFGPAGAMGGFALGHLMRAQREAGGTGEAEAAVARDGWTQRQVEEHLGLLRFLTAGGMTRAGFVDGDASPMGAHGPSMRSVAQRTVREIGKVNPNDPRIVAAAERNGIPLPLLQGLIEQESGFNPNAVSPKGARGLGQLMPMTARQYHVTDPHDVAQNADASAKHLSHLLTRYRSNVPLALAAYNAGEGNVAKYGGIPPFRETQNYVGAVSKRVDKFNLARLRERMTLHDVEQPESPTARVERDAMDRRFGPDEHAQQKMVVHLEPGPNFDGIIQPSRAVIPGVMRTR